MIAKFIHKAMFILLISSLFVGCNSDGYSIPRAYDEFCDRQPDSMSCIKHEAVGFAPNFQYVDSVKVDFYNNFKYTSDEAQYNSEDYWYDGVTIYGNTRLRGDCEDASLTFASQLILDGVNPKNIKFVVSQKDGKGLHSYIQVKLNNGNIYNFYKIDEYVDILYMRYDNIGIFNKATK